jgi:hypothetical protein
LSDLCCALSDEASTEIHLWFIESFDQFVGFPLAQTDIFPGVSICSTHTHKGYCSGVAVGNGQFATLSFNQIGWALVSVGYQQTTTHTVALPPLNCESRVPTPMVIRRDTFIAWGTELLKGNQVIADFERRITSLSAAPARSRSRLAVGFETGGVVYWDNAADNRLTLAFGAGLSDFITCFTRDGHLVAMGEQGGEVYDTRELQLRYVCKIDPPGSRVTALLPGVAINQFAVVLADGCILVYEV